MWTERLNGLTAKGKQYFRPWLVFWIAATLIFSYFVLSFFVSRGSTDVEKSSQLFVTYCEKKDTQGIPAEFLASDGCPNAVTAFIAFEEINVTKRTVRVWLRLYPQGEHGIALFNGGYFNHSLQVGFSAIGSGNWDVPSREWVGGKSITLPLESVTAETGYPFDVYKANFSLIINDAVSGDDVPLSIAFSTKRLSGFDVKPRLISKEEMTVGNDNIAIYPEGIGGFTFQVERSSAYRLQLAVLLAIIAIGAISATSTTVAVVKHNRPPSLSILAWLATYLFALIQVRGEFPGGPALAISVDRFFTFPAIALLMLLIVVNVISWLKRNDWDSENQDYVE